MLPGIMPDEITAAVNRPELDVQKLARLARDVAMNMLPLPETLERHGLTEAEYHEYVEKWPFYKHALEAATIEWTNPMNVQKRLQAESALLLEQALPELSARMLDKSQAMRDVAEVAKLFAKIAGVDGDKSKQPTGERVSITINLGDEKISFDKSATPIEATAVEIRTLPEGPPEKPHIQSQPEGNKALQKI
jgi:hypothetical protein